MTTSSINSHSSKVSIATKLKSANCECWVSHVNFILYDSVHVVGDDVIYHSHYSVS